MDLESKKIIRELIKEGVFITPKLMNNKDELISFYEKYKNRKNNSNNNFLDKSNEVNNISNKNINSKKSNKSTLKTENNEKNIYDNKYNLDFFQNFFKEKFSYFKNILINYYNLECISISKLLDNQNSTISGIILNIRETKNNYLIELEDDTKNIKLLLEKTDKNKLKIKDLHEDQVILVNGKKKGDFFYINKTYTVNNTNENSLDEDEITNKEKKNQNILYIPCLNIDEDFKQNLIYNKIKKLLNKKESKISKLLEKVDKIIINGILNNNVKTKSNIEIYEEIFNDLNNISEKIIILPYKNDLLSEFLPFKIELEKKYENIKFETNPYIKDKIIIYNDDENKITNTNTLKIFKKIIDSKFIAPKYSSYNFFSNFSKLKLNNQDIIISQSNKIQKEIYKNKTILMTDSLNKKEDEKSNNIFFISNNQELKIIKIKV
jgi:hypothetical protein